MSANAQSINSASQRKAGRRNFYGQPTIKRYVYWPPELEERLAREALSRNVRDGTHDKWSISRVVVADLAKLYGIHIQTDDGTTSSGNGR